MDIKQPTPNIDIDRLLNAIRNDYRSVALEPQKGYHFHTGRAALDRIGYDKTLYDAVPEECIASFAGTGNPFMLGTITDGDVVIDVGSGAGLDALIASTLVGAGGQVIGIDMTPAMLKNARSGAAAMGAENVEFREGFVDKLPFQDQFADVVISNGVLNLSLDKRKTLTEWARVLKTNGKLYVGDILIEKTIPQEALDDISLWTG